MWIPIAFVLSLVLTMALWIRMRSERLERSRWRGFQADAPMDATGLEQFDPTRYSAAGRKLYPAFVLSALAVIALGIIIFVRFVTEAG